MSDEYPDDWRSRRVGVLHRDDHTCQECGEHKAQDRLHVHHKKPISEGGSHRFENLETRCAECHAKEHDERVCDVCYLLASHVMDEVKSTGTVGMAHFCDEHYELIEERADLPGVGSSSYSTEGDGRCVFCLDSTSGRYTVHPHATNNGPSVLICGDCRIKIINGRERDKRELMRAIQEAEGGYD